MHDLLRKSLCLTLALVVLSTQTALAQQPAPPAAPVPTQITEARNVFISNAGADTFFLAFSGGSNRAYNDLYAAIKHWGRYQIASSPAQADLIFEVRSMARPSDVSGTDGNVSTTYNPQIRLQILDPKTRTVLWTLTSYIEAGGLQKTRDKQFDLAANGLFNQLRQLAGETLTPEEAKAAHARPRFSRAGVIFIVAIAAAAVVVPLVLFLHFRHSQPTLPTLPPCNTPFCPVA